ncbi:MAG: DUF1501 domain-containing protein [Betaproteobacteria bacterium]
MSTPNASRRAFCGYTAALAGLGAGTPLALNLAALGSAAAQGAPDYKALVCVFLFGGNDSYNTVLATDSASWSAYAAARTQAPEPIALAPPGTAADATAPAGSPAALGGVLPIVPATTQAGRTFALHPQLAPLTPLWGAGRLAVVANVGPLIAPTSKAQYGAQSVPLPARLFSHNDQQSTWQSGGTEGAREGWGGRIADLIAANNGSAIFTAISVAGSAVWLAGRQVTPYQVGTTGPVRINALTGNLFGATAAAANVNALVAAERTALLEGEHAAIVARSIAAEAQLSAALPPAGAAGVPDPTPFVNPLTGNGETNALAVQLQVVARAIAARSALGAKRQVFFVSLGGFDTHDGQNRNQARLLGQLAHALAYFDGALANVNGADLRASVTTFTASDFGRTLTSNGDGTDHGWGAHHFLLGGAVRGGDLYGRFPTVGLNHGDEVGSGRLLPAVAVDQYAATLGKWFGLGATQLDDVLPNLRNFNLRDLGFLRT